jgi:anti-anti-sigma factor
MNGDVPCTRCGQLLWFVRKPLGEAVILTFFPGPIVALDSITRVKLVASAAGDLSRVVVNLSHLLFIPTVFLGMLVAIHRRVGEAGGELRLYGLHPRVLATFKATNVDRMFNIYDSEQSALASF